MLKQLLKKQMLEMFQSFFVDRKKNKARTKTSTILMIVGYVILFGGLFGGMFSMFTISLLPLVDYGYDWMIFVFIGLIAIAFGAFGSVFNTYSGLYLAKDNDMLLSMPIPVKYIMASRLLGVYIMGTIYSALVIIPSIIVYLSYIPFRATALIGCVLFVIIISLIVMLLSCTLGWVVAKISSKLKNKSMITVIVSLAFISVYYVFYFKANELIRKILANADEYGAKIKGSAYPLYVFGKIGTGDLIAAVAVLIIVGALCGLAYYVIARSFIKIATSSQNITKKKYTEKSIKTKNPDFALLGKELSRFFSSPNYMLNCGLGILVLVAAGIFVLIKGYYLENYIVSSFGNENIVCVAVITMICLLTAMNCISAPSVSLEGKNIWLVQSLPVSSWQIIKAKRNCHFILTSIPALICGICADIALKPSILGGIMIIILPQFFVLLCDMFGLFLNLKNPNLTWTNEVTPIKQSFSTFVVPFVGWIYSICIILVFFPFRERLSGELYLVGFASFTGLLCLALDSWLRKKGTKIFAEL